MRNDSQNDTVLHYVDEMKTTRDNDETQAPTAQKHITISLMYTNGTQRHGTQERRISKQTRTEETDSTQARENWHNGSITDRWLSSRYWIVLMHS